MSVFLYGHFWKSLVDMNPPQILCRSRSSSDPPLIIHRSSAGRISRGSREDPNWMPIRGVTPSIRQKKTSGSWSRLEINPVKRCQFFCPVTFENLKFTWILHRSSADLDPPLILHRSSADPPSILHRSSTNPPLEDQRRISGGSKLGGQWGGTPSSEEFFFGRAATPTKNKSC